MESTTSLSQGSFLFLPDGFSLLKQRAARKRKLDERVVFKWESAYNRVWGTICQDVNEINKQLFSKILKDLVEHLKKVYNNYKLDEEVIPCEILLTGSNLPDHKLLLSTFVSDITAQITPYVASLWSWNCNNIKSIVFNFVSQIIPVNKFKTRSENDFEIDTNDSPVSEEVCKKNYLNISLLLSQYNMSTLAAWYNSEYKNSSKKKPAIIIIFPDFESFIPAVLGEFILLLSSYATKIPIVLVFGVATTPIIVYQNLTRNVLSQLVIQIFRSEQSPAVFNNVIENVLLAEKCPFRLGEKCMNFLTDIFLFHSFSVHAFVQGLRYCMVEHFYKRNHYTLCCTMNEISDEVNQLSSEELESIRRLASFQKYVESKDKDERKLLLLDDEHTRDVVKKMMKEILAHSKDFYFGLKILHNLTYNLPDAPLGRHIREYYCKCLSCNVHDSDEYKECMKLLEMQSKKELISKIKNLIKVLSPSDEESPDPEGASAKLKHILVKLKEFEEQFCSVTDTSIEDDSKHTEKAEYVNSFEEIKKNFLTFIEDGVVKILLFPPKDFPLQEIIYFDDLGAVGRRISGSPRSAIHLALNNPQCYLNCKCCVLSSPDAILPTLPDLSIAYKIHLEHNKIINVYDWLQSFAAVVKENKTVSEEEEEREIQARFTRAISELQFLGFIKPSRVKVDHVARLTWENA